MKTIPTIEQIKALQVHKLKCKAFKISAAYDEDVVYPAMDTYAQQKASEVVKELEAQITGEAKHIACENGVYNSILIIKKHFNLV